MSQSSRLQRLLIATDLSIRAEHAFNRAVQLALQNNAKLTVLHVIPDELEPTFSEALTAQVPQPGCPGYAWASCRSKSPSKVSRSRADHTVCRPLPR